jgi:hypothetical protein
MGRPDLALSILAMPVDAIGGKTAKHVALAIAIGWADAEGRARFLYQDVAASLGLCAKAVGKAVDTLRAKGVIEGTAAIDCRFLIAPPEPGSGGTPFPTGTPFRSTGTPFHHRNAVPPERGSDAPERRSVPPERGSGRAERRSRADSVQTSSLPPSPPGLTSKEEGDARASDRNAVPPERGSGAEWQPLPVERKTLEWVERHQMPLRLADGTDLRPEWIAALRWLFPKEADEIRAAMVGDLPSAFRAAALPWEPTRESRARHAAAMTKALEGAEADAQREAAGVEAERKRAERAEIERRRVEDAQTGTFLEQGRALLAAVEADRDRSRGMTSRTVDLFASLMTQVRAGRVLGATVGNARLAWNETTAPPPEAAPAAEPTPDLTFHGDHPAAPDRDPPLVVLDDDAPPVDEDPVVDVIRGFLKRLGAGGKAAGAEAVDAWLAHLVLAGAAMTSSDAIAYLDLAVRIANQRGIFVLTPDDVPSAALVAWATLAGEAALA